MAKGVVRVFTSNAKTPHDWFHVLPQNLEKPISDTWTAADRRKSCSSEALILLKRVVFIRITEKLINKREAREFLDVKANNDRSKASEFLA